MVMNVIIEDESGNPPSQAELGVWASTFGLTIPVVADPGAATLFSYATSGSIGLPFTVLLDRGVVVENVEYPSSSEALALARAGR